MSRGLTVLDAGPMTTVQDRGRPGWAHLGVPRSGAVDLPAAALSNRLVGNPVGAAVLESTLGGLAVRATTAMTLAVTGAEADVTVDGRGAPQAEPVTVRAGQVLAIGTTHSGLRCYLAAAGGIDVPPVLGSRSTDTLSGTGPAPVAAGHELPVGDPVGDPQGVDVSVVRRVPSPASLRFVPGPREDWFTERALETFTGSTYTCSPESNRVGIRLQGPRLERSRREELPSEALVLGAVQVPASGEPLVFLNDHPVTGGYPVIGVVLPEDLPICGQLRPGDRVRFTIQSLRAPVSAS